MLPATAPKKRRTRGPWRQLGGLRELEQQLAVQVEVVSGFPAHNKARMGAAALDDQPLEVAIACPEGDARSKWGRRATTTSRQEK